MSESEKEIWRAETLARINNTTENTNKILKSTKETRIKHETEVEETKKLREKWSDFETRFNKSIRSLWVRIVETLEGSGLRQNFDEIEQTSKFKPEIMDSK